MNDRTRFGKGMLALSLGLKMYGRELTKPMQEVYWLALADLTDDEFDVAAAVLLKRETEFPPPAMFLEVARPQVDRMAHAHRVMCQALLLTEYDPEGGNTWRASTIAEKIGPAASEAFLACGGAPGFRDYDSPFHGARVRRDFCEVYARAIEADPHKALPAPRKAICSPEMQALTQGIGREMPRLERPAWVEPAPKAPRVLTEEELEAKREGFRELARQSKPVAPAQAGESTPNA